MKKLLIFLGVLLLVSGCGKYNDKDLIKELSEKTGDISHQTTWHQHPFIEIDLSG